MERTGWLERKTAEVFDEGLKRAFGDDVEPRPQQRHLSLAVARTFENGGKLVAEAPTGIGKTFAYLVPAILLARETGSPAWIATESLALQDQILRNDLPAACRATGIDAAGAAAKGRSNHLCLLRAGEAFAKAKNPAALAALASWSEKGGGDLSGFIGRGWGLGVSAGSDEAFCGRKCPLKAECILTRARAKAAAADIVVLNHAMAMRSIAAPDAEFAPPPPCCAVFDECHRLESAASGAFGKTTSRRTVMTLLAAVSKADPELMPLAKNAAAECTKWFRQLAYGMMLHGFGNGPMSPRGGCPTQPKPLTDALEDVAKNAKGPAWAFGRLLFDAVAAINAFSYKKEGSADSRWAFAENGDLHVHCDPVFPHGTVAGCLPSDVPVAAVSATVAPPGMMDSAASAMGLAGAETLVLPSPFGYEGVGCFAAKYGVPSPDSRDFPEAASRILVERFLPMTGGRAFILFTSLETLAKFAAVMEKGLEKAGMNAVVQHEGDSASGLVERFRNTERAVLFGCASFWTGVDIPGEALSQVVVMRLPFPTPADPMESAKIHSMGREWFWKRALPMAYNTFRQGIGRLVRRKTDRGVIVLMDKRAYWRKYGRQFLDALPQKPVFF